MVQLLLHLRGQALRPGGLIGAGPPHHSTVKTLYIRFYLEEHNQQLLAPPVYRPVVLTLEQQAAYLEKVRHRISRVIRASHSAECPSRTTR